MNRRNRCAFTLVELLVVIAIIGILIALLLPAIQAAREAARRAQCSSSLAQIGLALHHYATAHEVLPPGVVDPGGPITSAPQGMHMGWLVQLLPYLGENVIYKHVDFAVGVYDPKNAPVATLPVAIFRCPSTSRPSIGAGGFEVSNFAGCHNSTEARIDASNNGVLFLNSSIDPLAIPDGAAHTIFAGEKLGIEGDLGWMSGSRATLRNTGTPINKTEEQEKALGLAVVEGASGMPVGMAAMGSGMTPSAGMAPPPAGVPEAAPAEAPDVPSAAAAAPAAPPAPPEFVGGFESQHPGGANFLLGDGGVEYVTETIDAKIYQQLGDRSDGQLLRDPFLP